MLKLIALLLIVLTITVSAQTKDARHAILPYEGHCEIDHSTKTFACRGKGQSADFVTRVTPSGEVHMNVHTLHGAVSVWHHNGTWTDQGLTVQGNFTFGTHSSHNDHSLVYTATGRADLQDRYFAVNGLIHGGKGSWEHASGVISSITQAVGDDGRFIGGVIFFVDP